jgi:alkylated DNA repair dioxygenase AlkB
MENSIDLPFIIEHPSLSDVGLAGVDEELCPINEFGELVKIEGLRYYRDAFTPDEQEELLRILYEHPWQSILARRQQFYGEVYYHTSHKNLQLQPTNDSQYSQQHQPIKQSTNDETQIPISLPLEALKPYLQAKCEKFFGDDKGFPSQILINEYRNNLGIASHFEDFLAFGPTILTISLISPIYMTLKKPKVRCNSCHEYWDIQKIYLEPGSLLVMEGNARYEYRHGISKYKWIHLPTKRIIGDQPQKQHNNENHDDDGTQPNLIPPICRDESYRRVSITLRHLQSTRRQVTAQEDETESWRYQGLWQAF